MRVSLVHVAARAGVSPGTVSRVLTGNAAARIAPATQERVRQIAAQMGYRPNIHARGLRGTQTRTLGFSLAGLGNPFHIGVARALACAASDAGYQSLFYAIVGETWNYPDWQKSTWAVDGAVVWSRNDLHLAADMGARARAIPVVCLGYEGQEPVDSVCFGVYAGARRAVEYLVRRGYCKIVHVCPRAPAGGPTEERGLAYADVCLASGLEARFHYLDADSGDYVRADGVRAGLDLAARPRTDRPEAVFCYNDTTAIGVYHGLRRAGIRVPDDIGLVGFDGIEEGQCLDVPLTTVACPPQPLATIAIETVLRRIRGESCSEPMKGTVPTDLLIGGTTR